MLPLQGVKVVDLGRVLAGPYASMLLADLGADVIKIEKPGGNGDEMRAYGPPFLKDRDGADTSESPYYLSANRNKRALCVDISSPAGQEIVRSLVRDADVLIENFKVGDLARYGLDYESLSKTNDKLIYCSITGFGQTGPMAKQLGMDIMFQSLSGLMSMTGEADGRPLRVGMGLGDIIGGMNAAYAVLGALYHRDVHGGRGQWIDLSLLDATFALLSHRMQTYLVSGKTPPRLGNATSAAVPADSFECADGMLMVQASYDHHFKRLCKALGMSELGADPRFALRKNRYANRQDLIPVLKACFLQKTVAEWQQILSGAEVLCAPINDLKQAVELPQIQHRGMVVSVDHALAGPLEIVGNPVRYSQTPIGTYTAPPTIGQHTDEIMSEHGYGEQAVADLRRQGVIQ